MICFLLWKSLWMAGPPTHNTPGPPPNTQSAPFPFSQDCVWQEYSKNTFHSDINTNSLKTLQRWSLSKKVCLRDSGRARLKIKKELVYFFNIFRSARTSYRAFVRPPVPSTRANFSWVHRWAVTLPSDLRDPSHHTFSESPWCRLSKFGRKYKYKDKYRDKYKDRDK